VPLSVGVPFGWDFIVETLNLSVNWLDFVRWVYCSNGKKAAEKSKKKQHQLFSTFLVAFSRGSNQNRAAN
jgi:hypothetical protein